MQRKAHARQIWHLPPIDIANYTSMPQNAVQVLILAKWTWVGNPMCVDTNFHFNILFEFPIQVNSFLLCLNSECVFILWIDHVFFVSIPLICYCMFIEFARCVSQPDILGVVSGNTLTHITFPLATSSITDTILVMWCLLSAYFMR